MNEYLLVMTACIDPSSGEYRLHRSDPAIRLEDYKSALRYWLTFEDLRVHRILFVDNSGFPLDSLEEIARIDNPHHKEVEFISLSCNWYPPGGHYGYAELRMLDLALQRSMLRRKTRYLIKVSGRLIFPGISKLLDRIPEDFDAVADARAWRTLLKRHERPHVTTQVILFRSDFYRDYLQDCYLELEDGPETHMEGIYYKKLAQLASTHRIIFRFPCNVVPVGFPAHRSRPYGHPSQLALNAFRAAARRLAPNWWL